MRAVLLLGAAALASATSKPWLTDEARMKYASDLKPVTPPRYTVDLDLPQGERWRTIGTGFADTAGPALVNYLKENLPDGWLAPLEKVAVSSGVVSPSALASSSMLCRRRAVARTTTALHCTALTPSLSPPRAA